MSPFTMQIFTTTWRRLSYIKILI